MIIRYRKQKVNRIGCFFMLFWGVDAYSENKLNFFIFIRDVLAWQNTIKDCKDVLKVPFRKGRNFYERI